jgi:hypothetical protein
MTVVIWWHIAQPFFSSSHNKPARREITVSNLFFPDNHSRKEIEKESSKRSGHTHTNVLQVSVLVAVIKHDSLSTMLNSRLLPWWRIVVVVILGHQLLAPVPTTP